MCKTHPEKRVAPRTHLRMRLTSPQRFHIIKFKSIIGTNNFHALESDTDGFARNEMVPTLVDETSGERVRVHYSAPDRLINFESIHI